MNRIVLVCLIFLTGSLQAQTTVIPAGSVWKYSDNGVDQGTAWKDSVFNDAGWSSGNAQMGYGEGDEATVLNYGGVPSNKYPTYYFRKKVNISNATSYVSFDLNIKRDDGAVIYVNGNEVMRSNMPAGTIVYSTLAASDASDDGQSFNTQTIPATGFVNGDNYIAIEVHQFTVSSSDVSFDFSLVGNAAPPAPVLVRGPYLQVPTSTSMIVRWRTNINSVSKVSYGLSVGNLTSSVVDNTPKTEHIITLTGLLPNTKYFYSVGDNSNVLQGDANNYFTTFPTTGTPNNSRIWVLGDHGTKDQPPRDMRDAFLNYSGSRRADLMIMLGDNAYNDGSDADYQAACFQNQLEGVLKNMPVTPATGNHEMYTSDATNQTGPYYDIFSLPKNGEGGGVPSGTEAYYSYNYGQIHFVALESTTPSFRTNGGAQQLWLQNDLAANTQKWTIVYFHHPPHSKGSHNCDTEIELIEMRQNFAPILEQYKVDLVLAGHSHSYERSIFMNGLYGLSGTFSTVHKVDSTSGSINAPYLKLSSKNYNGTVYAQMGCSGVPEPVGGEWPHPAMSSFINNTLGSLVIDVNADSLTGRFINGNVSSPAVLDEFRIVKQCDLSASINPVGPFCPSSPNATLSASPAGGTFSGPGVTGTTFSPSAAGVGVHTVNYNYSDGRCSTMTSVQIIVTTPQITAPSTNICAGSNVAMTASSGTAYQWYRNSVIIANATNQTYLASSNGTYYCKITSASCGGNSNTLVLTVVNNPTPTISASGPTSFCSPGSVTINSSTFTGVTFQWQKNGTNIANATNQSYVAVNAGSYRVIQTANGCYKTSTAITVTNATSVSASIAAGGPTTFCNGGSVSLSVVNAIPGYSFQWKNNGTNISGATTSVYSATASGSYTCQVSASCGNAASGAIVVSVGSINTSVSPSGTVSICSGGSVSLNAFSDPGYSYQWKLNGNVIQGATLSSYSANAAGDYLVEITTACGVASSAVTTVNVGVSSITISAGGSTTFCPGGSVTLNVDNVVSGFTYQWQNNGVDISGATATSYVASAAGNYSCNLSGPCGNAGSNVIVVTVQSGSASISPSGNISVCNGTATLLTANSGSGLTYQWKNNGNNIAGATNLTYNAVTAGSYTADVTGVCGTITSQAAVITNSPGAIAITPAPSTSFCAGLSFQLTATTGSGFTYQWMRNGVNIANGTNSVLTASSAGSYIVKITQGLCTATSAATAVTQINNTNPAISPSTTQTICNGSQVPFTTNNYAGVTYQWQKNGTDISGAVLQNYNAVTSGTYRVRQTANGCSKTSPSVTVSVINCGRNDEGRYIGNSMDFKLSPNPFSGSSVLFVPAAYEPSDLKLSVYNALGKEVYLDISKQTNGFIISRTDQPVGVYFLKVKDSHSKELFTSKIIIN